MFCSCHATILRKTNHFFILFFQRFSAFYPFFNFFLKRSVFLLSVVLGDAPMGRLYFVAPHSNNIEQHRTTRDNFLFVVLDCHLHGGATMICCIDDATYGTTRPTRANYWGFMRKLK